MRAFEKLKKALVQEFKTLPAQKKEQKNIFQQTPAPLLLKNSPKEWVALEQAVGRVCAKTFGRFPPCIPCVFEGEMIDEKAIERVREADNVFGLKDGKILVYQIRE
jgi:arginine/lysine/ornithine decarboxylase